MSCCIIFILSSRNKFGFKKKLHINYKTTTIQHFLQLIDFATFGLLGGHWVNCHEDNKRLRNYESLN